MGHIFQVISLHEVICLQCQNILLHSVTKELMITHTYPKAFVPFLILSVLGLIAFRDDISASLKHDFRVLFY